MTTTYPAGFARFYDTIYHSLRDTVDNEYFQGQISNTQGKILEVGTGTGRLFIDALNRGADIYGLDISESMLGVLKEKLNKDQFFRLSHQNIIDFTFPFKFDLVLAPFRVIMHLIDKEDQIKALNNVFDHLNAGGKFIFDTFVPDLRQLANGLKDHVDFEGEYMPGKSLKRIVSTEPDLINQVINISFKLDWEEDEEVKHDRWDLPLRFFFRYELEHLVERSKFGSFKIYGDYNGNELSSDSKEFVVVCSKD
ncbi:MAG TPA: class I SAM-dependent methyltransferase [Bacteroidales bacterium]|nr:class I SAM-dependent methyltransferase [Bacteroidales bacterium]